MATWIDVAKHILEQCGEMTAMKLQKLVYYSQAWNLVWEEEPLFPEEFEAWANGPVLAPLYARHRGTFKVDQSILPDGSSARLSDRQRDNISKVLGFYGAQNAQWLSNLTHQETPWLAARQGVEPGAPANTVISKASIHEYYSSL